MPSFRRFLFPLRNSGGPDGGQLRGQDTQNTNFLTQCMARYNRWRFEMCDQEMKPASQLSAIAASILDKVPLEISVCQAQAPLLCHALHPVLGSTPSRLHCRLCWKYKSTTDCDCVAEVLFVLADVRWTCAYARST